MAPSSTSPLVLLVDDERDHVEMYQVALEIAGFDVIAAYDGASAIAGARARTPSVIVLDLRLPDMNGWDVCAALKADGYTRDIPIIILTAAAFSTLPQQAEKAGCAACLLKPCFPEDLIRALRDAIRAHRRSPEI